MGQKGEYGLVALGPDAEGGAGWAQPPARIRVAELDLAREAELLDLDLGAIALKRTGSPWRTARDRTSGRVASGGAG